MNAEKAKSLLIDAITEGGSLSGWICDDEYMYWTPGDPNVTVNGRFTADTLEAIAFWMRSHSADGAQ